MNGKSWIYKLLAASNDAKAVRKRRVPRRVARRVCGRLAGRVARRWFG